MSYKRNMFVENLDNILQDVNEVFILDRSGCIVELQYDGEYYSAMARVYYFKKYPEEWKFWFDTVSPAASVAEIRDDILGEPCDISYVSSSPIKLAIIQLLANRKDLRDIIIEADGQIVIE
nr:MAG TPA: hypothetical protein [Caudoviricetes sp.]